MIQASDDSSGFAAQVARVTFDQLARERLRATCDRWFEARFFVQQVANVPVEESQVALVNWYGSAHFAATIAIRDAARTDFEQLNRNEDIFSSSAIAQEFFLTSGSPEPGARDPLAINKVYRDLRNLRIHHAQPLIYLQTRVLLPDISASHGQMPEGRPRWFLRPLDFSILRRLQCRQMSEAEVTRFNEWIETRPLVTVLFQHLYVLSKAIEETAESMAP